MHTETSEAFQHETFTLGDVLNAGNMSQSQLQQHYHFNSDYLHLIKTLSH